MHRAERYQLDGGREAGHALLCVNAVPPVQLAMVATKREHAAEVAHIEHLLADRPLKDQRLILEAEQSLTARLNSLTRKDCHTEKALC